jgi:hypothetical protein
MAAFTATPSNASKASMRRMPVVKRTSQGIDNKPKGKHARKNWKAYRGQGRP